MQEKWAETTQSLYILLVTCSEILNIDEQLHKNLLKVIFAQTLFSYLVGVVKIHFLVLEDWASVHVLFLGAWCEVLLIRTIPFYTIKWILLKIIQMKWKLWIIKDNLKRRVVHLLTSQFDKWTVKVKGNMLTIQHKTER